MYFGHLRLYCAPLTAETALTKAPAQMTDYIIILKVGNGLKVFQYLIHRLDQEMHYIS